MNSTNTIVGILADMSRGSSGVATNNTVSDVSPNCDNADATTAIGGTKRSRSSSDIYASAAIAQSLLDVPEEEYVIDNNNVVEENEYSNRNTSRQRTASTESSSPVIATTTTTTTCTTTEPATNNIHISAIAAAAMDNEMITTQAHSDILNCNFNNLNHEEEVEHTDEDHDHAAVNVINTAMNMNMHMHMNMNLNAMNTCTTTAASQATTTASIEEALCLNEAVSNTVHAMFTAAAQINMTANNDISSSTNSIATSNCNLATNLDPHSNVNLQTQSGAITTNNNRTINTNANVNVSANVNVNGSRRDEVKWLLRLTELRQFKVKHEHCRVPEKYKENPQLGKWVRTQRAEYKKYRQLMVQLQSQEQQDGLNSNCNHRSTSSKRSSGSCLTPERIALLEIEGFEWSLCTQKPFEERLRQLRVYKEQYGDCMVPQIFPDNPSLGLWVREQRQEFKKFNSGRKSHMTEQRIQQLEELGFVWSKLKTPQVPWKVRLQELCAFKLKYGHCKVPKDWSGNPQLGKWVSNQRGEYKKRIQGKKSSLTSERLFALDDVGFVWTIIEQLPWNMRLDELIRHREEHGNTLVPKVYSANPQLGKWVQTQRSEYKKFQVDPKSSDLSAERIIRLEDEGFVWSVTERVPWRQRRTELEAYKRTHGDCNVPESYGENLKLAKWVARQRAEYSKFKNGKKSAMKHEHLLILENMGFEWNAFPEAYDEGYPEINPRESSFGGDAVTTGGTGADDKGTCSGSPAVKEEVDTAVIVAEVDVERADSKVEESAPFVEQNVNIESV